MADDDYEKYGQQLVPLFRFFKHTVSNETKNRTTVHVREFPGVLIWEFPQVFPRI